MEYTMRKIAPGEALDDAHAVRMEVFVREQGFSPETEMDETDAVAWHVVLYDAGVPVATGRMFSKPGDGGTYILGRIAVRKAYRGRGVGRLVVDKLESLARAQGATALELGAQCQASGFYKTLGYVAFGETYYEEHCAHVHMRKSV